MNQFKQLCLAVLSCMLLSTTVEAGRRRSKKPARAAARRARAAQQRESHRDHTQETKELEMVSEDEFFAKMAAPVRGYTDTLYGSNYSLEETLNIIYLRGIMANIAEIDHNTRAFFFLPGNVPYIALKDIFAVVKSILDAAKNRQLHMLSEDALAEPLKKSLSHLQRLLCNLPASGIPVTSASQLQISLEELIVQHYIFLAMNKELIVFIAKRSSWRAFSQKVAEEAFIRTRRFLTDLFDGNPVAIVDDEEEGGASYCSCSSEGNPTAIDDESELVEAPDHSALEAWTCNSCLAENSGSRIFCGMCAEPLELISNNTAKESLPVQYSSFPSSSQFCWFL